MAKVVTVYRHIIETQRMFPDATGGFTGLLSELCFAMKIIAREVNRAGLADILGFAGRQNVQGEDVRKLDEFANDLIYKAMDHGGHLCVMASEEDEELLSLPERYPRGKYVLVFDPLDGSSNIDANVSIGTIFGVFRRVTPDGDGTLEDILQTGYRQVAAGYVIYGSSTVLVYTTGHGVHGFTLDPSVGEFLLSHPDIKTPKRGKIYSANEGNAMFWREPMTKYIDHVKSEANPSGKPYTSRYIGSLVADFHRNLLYGGIFLYPEDSKDAKKPDGKLRLVYEGFPLAFIAEQAGGKASDGRRRILDITPTELHQRTPLIIGSTDDVGEYERFVAEHASE